MAVESERERERERESVSVLVWANWTTLLAKLQTSRRTLDESEMKEEAREICRWKLHSGLQQQLVI